MGHLHTTSSDSASWAFPGPDNQAVYSRVHVVDRSMPVLRVTHDEDDESWQFLCGGLHEAASEGRLVCLGCMVARDKGLLELADLPLGWCADRETASDPWERSPNSPSPDK
jgi:hypothetical protein